jgi:hypothetical protein
LATASPTPAPKRTAPDDFVANLDARNPRRWREGGEALARRNQKAAGVKVAYPVY